MMSLVVLLEIDVDDVTAVPFERDPPRAVDADRVPRGPMSGELVEIEARQVQFGAVGRLVEHVKPAPDAAYQLTRHLWGLSLPEHLLEALVAEAPYHNVIVTASVTAFNTGIRGQGIRGQSKNSLGQEFGVRVKISLSTVRSPETVIALALGLPPRLARPQSRAGTGLHFVDEAFIAQRLAATRGFTDVTDRFIVDMRAANSAR